MPGREGEVRAAVESPEFVRRKPRVDFRENHYRRPAPDAPWTNVVVAYDLDPITGTWSGTVVTAFRNSRPDPKEVQLWP